MKTLLNKTASAIAGLGIVLVGCVMAGLGLSVMVLLALFALAILGLGLLAAPFVALAQRSEPSAPDAEEVIA